ncbi:MAG: hypothetical protein ACFFFT_04860 [Candidatus Thorarchaeota archaeon]
MMYKEKIIKYQVEIVVFSIFFFYLLVVRMNIPIFQGWGYPIGKWVIDWDYYARMSQDIFLIFKSQIIKPFCYRPLVPLIGGLLPFDLETNYSLINFFAIYFTGVVLYFTLRIKFNKGISIFGLFVFCYLNYLPTAGIELFPEYAFFHALFYEVYNVDSMILFFLMWSFYCIFSDKRKLYCISLVLGVLVKEFILITIPVYLIYVYMKRDINKNDKDKSNALLRNTIYVVPGILTYLIMLVIVVPQPLTEDPRAYMVWYTQVYEGNDYGSIGMIMKWVGKRINQILHEFALLKWTIGSWGITLLALCFFNKKDTLIKWVKLYGLFMVLIYSQMLFGAAETKYIHQGFYPMIFLSASGLNRIYESLSSYIIKRTIFYR